MIHDRETAKKAASGADTPKAAIKKQYTPIIGDAKGKCKMKDYARNIDDLGRIVIPKEIRRINNINVGDLLSVKVTPEGILLSKQDTCCAVCGSTDNTFSINGQTLCRACIKRFSAVLEHREGE